MHLKILLVACTLFVLAFMAFDASTATTAVSAYRHSMYAKQYENMVLPPVQPRINPAPPQSVDPQQPAPTSTPSTEADEGVQAASFVTTEAHVAPYVRTRQVPLYSMSGPLYNDDSTSWVLVAFDGTVPLYLMVPAVLIVSILIWSMMLIVVVSAQLISGMLARLTPRFD